MSTRSKKKIQQKSQAEHHTNKHITSSWVLMVKDELCKNENFSIITLPHPSHGGPSKFCVDTSNKKMYEVVTYSEPYRSWFIGESVKSNGDLLMVTPFNAVFLILPRLREQCKSRAIPLEDLLSEKGFTKILDLIRLDDVADVKEVGDIKAFKYNEKKAIDWLEKRVRRLANVLKEKNIHVTSGAASATFVSSSISDIDPELYLKYAFGIVSEYLDDYFSGQLEKHFNFPADTIETVGNKRKTEENDNGVSKKLKYENNGEEENINFINIKSPETKAVKSLTAKEKARQKAASGSKTISSFFTKK
ncbi:ribonuclease H2 subunit B [Aricia agestis]|uniref:ribonuclease H2 subunit B n=1 Tax=Aricia agestis TaxID=91739 RepID=UPI001C2079D1|nr:ribonuclease H2 subunit B [Aricia agestis]